MASLNFDQTAPNARREAKIERDRLDDQVLQLLQQITGRPADVDVATAGLDMSEAMDSRLEFPQGGVGVDGDRIQILAEFLLAEAGQSRAMLAFSKGLRATLQASDGEKLDQAVKEEAIREFLAEYARFEYLIETFQANLTAGIPNMPARLST